MTVLQASVVDMAATIRRDRWRWVREYGVYIALALVVVFDLLFTSNFATTANVRTQLVQVSPVIVVALGMAMVIGTAGIDLSVGSVMALSAAVLPLYLGYGVVPAVLMCLVAGCLSGLLGGSLVAFVGVQPIVATLALLVGGRGLALVIADGQLKQISDPTILSLGDGSFLGISYFVLVAAGVALLVAFLVRRTTFGRQLVAVGGNRAASRVAGLPVRRVLLTVYVLSGVLAALAGVFYTARLTASDPSSIGQLYELSAITAVVVGGTPLAGGRVKVFGTLAGAMLVQLVRATIIKLDLPDSTAQLVQAAIILAAVFVQRERSAR